MKTRSGRVHEKKKKKHKLKSKSKPKRKFLTTNMIRKHGENTVNVCCICRARLQFVTHTDWLQCPLCKDVLHAKCLFRYCLESPENTRCPHCRVQSIPVTIDENDRIDIERVDKEWQPEFLFADSSSNDSDNESNSKSNTQETKCMKLE